MRGRAFTLVELLTVIAIIAILAGLLFPVFARAKEQAKKATCLSNLSQIGLATAQYLSDYDGSYPQTRQTSANPDVEDVSGNIDEPVIGSPFDLLQKYGAGTLYSCPVDPDPFGRACMEADPDAPDVTSYVVNGFFVFGLTESQVSLPAQTIYVSERRSTPAADVLPYCDNIYHPWFNATNPDAPENEMDPVEGAVAATRHDQRADYEFTDGHVKNLAWGDTFSLPAKNLHSIRQL